MSDTKIPPYVSLKMALAYLESEEPTPGPWEVSKHGTPEAFPQFGVYAVGDPNDLAIVKGDRAKADAQLIAAAPDLLRACQGAQAVLLDYVHGDRPEMCAMAESLESVLAAIAKAVGK